MIIYKGKKRFGVVKDAICFNSEKKECLQVGYDDMNITEEDTLEGFERYCKHMGYTDDITKEEFMECYNKQVSNFAEFITDIL